MFKTEYTIPFLYSIKRETLRFNLTFTQALFRYLSSITQNYIWVPIYALLFSGMFLEPLTYVTLCIHVVTFFLLYEAGYFLTDNLGIRFEDKTISNQVYTNIIPLTHVAYSVVSRLLLVSLLIFIFRNFFTFAIIQLYVLTFLVYTTHALIKEKPRIITHAALKILKGFVPYFFIIGMLPIYHEILIFIGLIGVSFYYTIEYGFRKWGRKLTFDYFHVKFWVFKYLFIYTLSLLAFFYFGIPIIQYSLFVAILAAHHVFFALVNQFKARF